MHKHRATLIAICCQVCQVTLLLLFSEPLFAQTEDLRLPISLDADSTDYDGKSSMLMFKGLRLTQGNIGVVADEGRATQLDFEESSWLFSGNVVIDVENGHMESELAELEFSGYQLKLATIKGSPATFEMQRPDNEEKTYAEAGELIYNFDNGVVEFSGNATITEGGNQISSNRIVYNIREQRIYASASEEGDSKVRMTYTPGDAPPSDDEGEMPPSDEQPEEEPNPENGETG